MTCKLKFHHDARNEWERLSATDKAYFRKKLAQRLENPHIPGSRLSGGFNLYKIKRKRPPLRLFEPEGEGPHPGFVMPEQPN